MDRVALGEPPLDGLTWRERNALKMRNRGGLFVPSTSNSLMDRLLAMSSHDHAPSQHELPSPDAREPALPSPPHTSTHEQSTAETGYTSFTIPTGKKLARKRKRVVPDDSESDDPLAGPPIKISHRRKKPATTSTKRRSSKPETVSISGPNVKDCSSNTSEKKNTTKNGESEVAEIAPRRATSLKIGRAKKEGAQDVAIQGYQKPGLPTPVDSDPELSEDVDSRKNKKFNPNPSRKPKVPAKQATKSSPENPDFETADELSIARAPQIKAIKSAKSTTSKRSAKEADTTDEEASSAPVIHLKRRTAKALKPPTVKPPTIIQLHETNDDENVAQARPATSDRGDLPKKTSTRKRARALGSPEQIDILDNAHDPNQEGTASVLVPARKAGRSQAGAKKSTEDDREEHSDATHDVSRARAKPKKEARSRAKETTGPPSRVIKRAETHRPTKFKAKKGVVPEMNNRDSSSGDEALVIPVPKYLQRLGMAPANASESAPPQKAPKKPAPTESDVTSQLSRTTKRAPRPDTPSSDDEAIVAPAPLKRNRAGRGSERKRKVLVRGDSNAETDVSKADTFNPSNTSASTPTRRKRRSLAQIEEEVDEETEALNQRVDEISSSYQPPVTDSHHRTRKKDTKITADARKSKKREADFSPSKSKQDDNQIPVPNKKVTSKSTKSSSTHRRARKRGHEPTSEADPLDLLG